MATVETSTSAARLPGPPELLPGRPDAIVDLQTPAGAALVGTSWRYSDADVVEIDFVDVGSEADPLGPGGRPNRTYDVVPHAEATDYDDSGWELLQPEETLRRLANGRVCFNWYRLAVTIPERIGDLDPSGATVVFEVVVDDYAEVWVDGQLPPALGQTGGQVVGGFNAPNRVVLTSDARPGQTFQLAVFGINGPISASAELHLAALGHARRLRGRAHPRRGGAVRAPGRRRRDRARGRHARADRRRLRVHRRPGLDARRRPPLQLAEHEHDLPLAGARRGHRLPLEERLHGPGRRPLPPAGLERPHLRP
ncbi:MAG: hypothetical protein WKF65_06975 [Gaiellaceae bacterium]